MPVLRKSFSNLALIFALLLALVGCGGDSQNQPRSSRVVVIPGKAPSTATENGYVLFNGKPATWIASSATFSFATNFPPQYESACMSAAQTWNQAMGRNFFQFSSGPQRNVITWNATPVDENSAESAQTTISGPGVIDKATIDFHTLRKFPYSITGEPDKMDVQSVCLHEFGHALGLAHVPEPGSIMYPVIIAGTWKRTLAQEDIANVRRMY